jgi:hypothetical protein
MIEFSRLARGAVILGNGFGFNTGRMLERIT